MHEIKRVKKVKLYRIKRRIIAVTAVEGGAL